MSNSKVISIFADMKKRDELTTAMHAELMEGEATVQEMKYLGVCGAMNRGLTKEQALRKYGISEEEYDTKGKAFLSS